MNRVRTIAAILTLPGLLALFLPFASDTSPFNVVLNPSDSMFTALIRLAGPMFLAVFIAVWMLRRLFASRMSAVEVVLAYLLSTLSMLSTLAFVFQLGSSGTDTGPILSLGAAWVLSLLIMLFHVRNIRAHLNAEDAAEAFLLAGYLPNAVFCLIVFSPPLQSGFFGVQMQSGALAVAVACVAYVTSIVLLVRRSGKEVAPPSQK